MSTPSATDIFLVQRGTTQHQVPFSRLKEVADADLLLVQRGATQHKVSGADLKAYLEGTSPGPVPWTPADEPTVTSWFDETFASSITLSSGSVSQWTSRVGTAVLSNGNQAQMPTKETGWLRFVSQELNTPALPTEAAFVVVRPVPTVGGRIYCAVLASTGVELLSLSYDEPGFGFTYEVVPSIPTFRQDGSPVVPSPNWGANTPTQSPRIPVASFGDPVLVAIDYPSNQALSRIGSSLAAPSGALHLHAQFVTLSGSPSLLIFQKLEGWAAHKYGVAGKLPANHPYKAAPPTNP